MSYNHGADPFPDAVMRTHVLSLSALLLLAAAPSQAQVTDVATSGMRPIAPVNRHLIRGGGHHRPGYDEPLPTDESPVDLPYRQIVDPARYVPGTVSWGTTSDGGLAGGARLPWESEAHFVLPEHRDRDTHYGTEELVQVVLDAARAYQAAYPGERIGVGNMSHAHGGDIRWSRSHNSGRDVDLAFPFVDEDGEPVAVTTLIHVNRYGRARDGSGWTMDFERAWRMVEGLLTSDDGHVQWIFVYAPLKFRILEAGEELGADPEVLEMARSVLHQPGDSAPHNDHFHVRLFCSRDDVLEGCRDVGPDRDFAPRYDVDLDARRRELIRGLMDPDGEVASSCTDFLQRLESDAYLPEIAQALPFQAPEAQLALIDWIAEVDDRGYTGLLVPLAESSADDAVRSRAFWALGRLADFDAAPGLSGMLLRDGQPLDDGTPLRLAAATSLRNIPDPRALEGLVAAISDEDPAVRAAVAHALHRTAATSSPFDPGADLSPLDRARLAVFWSTWLASHAPDDRDAWLSDAFEAAGYRVGNLAARPRLTELVRALRDDRDWVVFNADRQLVRHTPWWSPSESWSQARRAQFWEARVTGD